MRQYVHGDQAYDDPLEVLVADGPAVKRYLPLVDEAGSGDVTAVFDTNGSWSNACSTVMRTATSLATWDRSTR